MTVGLSFYGPGVDDGAAPQPIAPAGPPGRSAFQDWLLNGHAGQTFGEFLAAITGPVGPAAWALPAPWATGAAYQATAPSSVVTLGGETFVCLQAHVSASFPADLSAGRWLRIAAKGADGLTGQTGPASFAFPVTWQTGLTCTSVAPATTVLFGGEFWACAAPHTAGASFAADLAAGRWVKLAARGADGTNGINGTNGATGAQPWQTPPVPWAASTAYTATAPASSVTYGGESYVCSTTHTSGASFDGTKWTKVAQKGADGAPAAGAVLYSQAQGLASADRGTAKGNLRIVGCRSAGYTGQTITLTPDDVGAFIYSAGATTLTLPRTDQVEEGAAFELFVDNTSATVNLAPGEPVPYLTQAAGPIAAPQVFLPGNYRIRKSYIAWRVADISPPLSSLLLNDRAQQPSDAQRFQWLSNAGLLIPQCQCRLVCTSPTQITLMPEGGNQIWINGAYRTIPSGGLSGGNGGLAANTPYYGYTYMSGASPVLYVGAATPVADPTYGHKIVSGQPQFTYVGMVYTDANGQFQSAPGLVLSHYNRRDIEIVQKLASVTSSRSPAVELSAALRAYTLCHDDEIVSCDVRGGSVGNTGVSGLYQRLQALITLPNGAMVLGNDAQAGGTGNTNDKRHHSSRASSKTGGNGLAYGTALGGITGSDNNYTATFDNLIVTMRTRG